MPSIQICAVLRGGVRSGSPPRRKFEYQTGPLGCNGAWREHDREQKKDARERERARARAMERESARWREPESESTRARERQQRERWRELGRERGRETVLADNTTRVSTRHQSPTWVSLVPVPLRGGQGRGCAPARSTVSPSSIHSIRRPWHRTPRTAARSARQRAGCGNRSPAGCRRSRSRGSPGWLGPCNLEPRGRARGTQKGRTGRGPRV